MEGLSKNADIRKETKITFVLVLKTNTTVCVCGNSHPNSCMLQKILMCMIHRKKIICIDFAPCFSAAQTEKIGAGYLWTLMVYGNLLYRDTNSSDQKIS